MPTPTVLFAAISSVLTLAVLALVLRPLWRQRRLPATLLVIALSVLVFGLYRIVGTPAALVPASLASNAAQAPQSIDDAIAQLQADLQRDPRQVEGWRLLGRAYAAQQQADKSRDAYAQAAKLSPDDPDVLVEAAESRALAQPQRRFDTQAVAMLEHALEVQPKHQRARWFLGIAQRQSGDAAKAAATWETLLPMVDAKTAAPLREQIDLARKDAGLSSLPAPAVAPTLLSVQVKLDPQLAARVRLRGDASVFVIARQPNGPPMPLAVEKHAVSELPFTVTLDDSDGPMPTRKLSSVDEVELIARLSMSGNAIAQPGDLESKPVRVHVPAKASVELTIGAR